MYQCSATCCQKESYSMDDIQNCIDKCNAPVNQTQSFLQSELSNFQVGTSGKSVHRACVNSRRASTSFGFVYMYTRKRVSEIVFIFIILNHGKLLKNF